MNVPSAPIARLRRRSLGFSLVEVVLAVGIAALGIITVLGLIPHGLEISRKTGNEMASHRIASVLFAEYQAGDWSNLGSGTFTETRYFDSDGVEILTSSSNFEGRLAYVAEATIPSQGEALPSNAGGSSAQSPYLRRVIVQVANTADKSFNFPSVGSSSSSGSAANTPNIDVYSQLIAKYH